MPIKLGVVMDPIASIKIKKDSTFALLLEAQARGWEIAYMEPKNLFIRDGKSYAQAQSLQVMDDEKQWFVTQNSTTLSLTDLDVILMRKDPPFDIDYIYITYILELAKKQGTLVLNDPQSLRDANEKCFTTYFPQCCPPTLVSSQSILLKAFIQEQGTVILKPLEGMGGKSIYQVTQQDPNINVIMEDLTHHGQRYIMAQRFIPEIQAGDKRILLINGEPVPYALARLPAPGEIRANLAVGGQGVSTPLSKQDRWICEQVGETLRQKGLIFVGLDIIGDYLTEINVTSPTCIRELEQQQSLNICSKLLDCIEKLRTYSHSDSF